MYRTDNENYVDAFALQLIKEAEPVLIDPPDILQMGLLVDRNIAKRLIDVKILFDGYFMCPRSTDLDDAIRSHAITESCFIKRTYAKDNVVPRHVVSAKEASYYTGPISPIPNPLLIPAEMAFMFASDIEWTANKILGRKKLPWEYKQAEKLLKEKFLGNKGLAQMKNEIKKCKALSIEELYTKATEIYMKEHPDFSQSFVNIDTVLNPAERQKMGI